MRTPDEVAAMQRLHDLGWGTRVTEVNVAFDVLNRMLEFGRASYVRIV